MPREDETKWQNLERQVRPKTDEEMHTTHKAHQPTFQELEFSPSPLMGSLGLSLETILRIHEP